jgi:hypothetical protein
MHPMKLLNALGPLESSFDRFGDGVMSMQDKCTVCTKHTIGSEIILDASDGTSR